MDRVEIVSREEIKKAPPRTFKDYTVHVVNPDGSTQPIGTVDEFSETFTVKLQYAPSHPGAKYRVVERDYDETREPAMIESEVK